MDKTGYIAAITRGHNAGVCLVKDGKIVFSIEEERLSRQKYDGGPLAAMKKILEYTDKIDYLVVAHTQPLNDSAGRIDFTGDDMYTGFARKLGLIDRKANLFEHPQVIDLSHIHHKLHAACAFYRSGFEEAVAIIVDGAGTFIPMQINNENIISWETETIIDCGYPATFQTLYKHIGTRGPHAGAMIKSKDGEHDYDALITDRAGIVKVYEAVTQYCGFSAIEAGKTMGLFPYGKLNTKIPELFDKTSIWPLSNRNVIIPTYPSASLVNSELFEELKASDTEDLTTLQNRRDLAYSCQHQTQEEVVKLIKKAVDISGKRNVVISGGYGLNCVANYHYLDALKDLGINLYVEPISNDGGTAIGAAMLFYRSISQDQTRETRQDSLYLGPQYSYTDVQINDLAAKYGAELIDAGERKTGGCFAWGKRLSVGSDTKAAQ